MHIWLGRQSMVFHPKTFNNYNIEYRNISSDSILIFDTEVAVQGKDSITLSWKKKKNVHNIRSIATSGTWISDHGNASKRSPVFSSNGTIGQMKGIEAGDVGTVCLKTQVVDTDGRVANILTYIKDISFGRFFKLLVYIHLHSHNHCVGYMWFIY